MHALTQAEVDSAVSLVETAFRASGRTDAPALRAVLRCIRVGDYGEGHDAAARDAVARSGMRHAIRDGALVILPPGREADVVAAIGQIDGELETLKARMTELARRRTETMVEACKARLDRNGREHSGNLDVNGHPCDGSPTGICCYDAEEDPSLDDCLFCGKPDERS